MPAAVVAVAGYAAGAMATAAAVSAGFVVAGGIGAAVISGVTSMAVSSALSGMIGGGDNGGPQQAVAGPAGPAGPAAQAARGVLVNTASTIDPIPVIYGTRRIGGTRVLVESSGTDNTYLHIIIAHAEGEVDGFGALYFDNILSTDARFTGKFTTEHFTGSDAQAACTSLIAAIPGVWTSAHKLSGITYTYLRLTYDQDAWHGLPTITTDLRGRKIYDPRNALTAHSDNPALCLRDYLTHTRFGRGIASADIDDATFIAAANYCDATITTPSGTQKRYTCNAILDTSRPSIDNVRLLLTCMRGMLVFSGGKYKLVLDKADVAGFAFTEDNITGAWAIKLADKRSRFNRVRAGWINPANEWQPDIALIDSTTYRSADNALLLEDKIDLPCTTNAYEAQMLAQRHLKQSRFGITASFRATIAGLGCEVGDLVTITHSTPGWTAKVFRVLRIALLSSDEVEITGQEYDDSVYATDPLTAPRTSVTTNLPNPFSVAAPGALTLSSGTETLLRGRDGTILSRINATWPAPTDVFVRSAELQIKPSAAPDTDWTRALLTDAADGTAYALDVTDGTAYDLRLRFENGLSKRSAWTTVTGHTVIGKTAPPADASNFQINGETLTWIGVTDVDLAGYQIRWQPGSNLSWGDAQPLHDGLIVSSPHTMINRPSGPVTLLLKAVDTSGNVSATAQSIVANLGDPILANIIVTFDYHADTFPGTRSNATVEGGTGDLIADADPSPVMWRDNEATNLWAADPDALMWNAVTYKAMSYIDGFTVDAADAGAQITLERDIAGTYTLEWRPVGMSAMWGADDAALMWADDGAALWTQAPWTPWPGSVSAVPGNYEIRVSTADGAAQGRIAALAIHYDVPDLQETLADIAIGSGGTRLPLTHTYRAIKTVNLTLQTGSGSALTAKAIDKNASLGPLIQCFNTSNSATTGTVDAIIQGY